MFFLCFTQLTGVLLSVLVTILACVFRNKRTETKGNDVPEPPTPIPLPFIGHLHLLGGYEVPYQAFTALSVKYGDLIRLKLGSVQSVVVNGQKNIREVLVTKGHLFDSRPNFERYQRLFGGNKENSLAFCDWSDVQRARRDMLRAYTFPRAFTNKFSNLESVISKETSIFLNGIANQAEIKPLVLQTCANIFTEHFCSKSFTRNDSEFLKMVESFDEIFYEVNQGYAADFLPILLPFHNKNLRRMNHLTENIREFILRNIIGKRFDDYVDEDPRDYVESLIRYVKLKGEPEMSWETALFALEDIIGGHAAVGNFLVKILGFLVEQPTVQKKIQEEIDSVTWMGNQNRDVTILDRNYMPYTEGTIFEAIRLIASPIVPRVANQDCIVNGYKIKKNSLIFLNNYDLSMSKDLWEEPEQFKPERFIQNNRFVKPEHFLPFGGGRRSCMGYKMVQLTTFGILSGLLQKFTILPIPSESYKVPIGSLALPTKNTFKLRFLKR